MYWVATRLGNYEAITNEIEGGRHGVYQIPCSFLAIEKCRRKSIYGRVTLSMKDGWICISEDLHSFKKKIYVLYVFTYVYCICIPHVYRAHGSQKRASDPPE